MELGDMAEETEEGIRYHWEKLFLKWGIRLDDVYEVAEQATRPVAYAERFQLEQEILRRRDDFDAEEMDEPPLLPEGRSRSCGQLHTPAPEQHEHRRLASGRSADQGAALA